MSAAPLFNPGELPRARRVSRDPRLALAAARLAAAPLPPARAPRSRTATSSPGPSSPASRTELTLEPGDPLLEELPRAALAVEGVRDGADELRVRARKEDETRVIPSRAHASEDDEVDADRRVRDRELVAEFLGEVEDLRRGRTGTAVSPRPERAEAPSSDAIARAAATTPPAGTRAADAPHSPQELERVVEKLGADAEELRRALLEAVERERKAREALEARVQVLEEELAGRRERLAREARRRRRTKGPGA
jgi:hypothetical protein